nr:venom carboxylesterase [Phaedon brassicae]
MLVNKWLPILTTISYLSARAELLVDLPNGKIEGYARVTPNQFQFHAFQGIPFAKPPLGQLRFQPPLPHPGWKGVLATKKDGNRCFSQDNNPKEKEDCLSLNVFTPVRKIRNATLVPVMVYFHGGGFTGGGNSYDSYGPDYLLEHGVVMVSANYRCGAFGFLSTGDHVVPGNVGLKDQVLALQWVQRNIELFGGDKEKVTIFGQSAGGASVGLHIVSKMSAGLFRGVIAESGSGVSVWAYDSNPYSYGHKLAAAINSTIEFNNSLDLIEFLRTIPAEEIDKFATNISKPLPVIEVKNPTAFLTEPMYESLLNGNFNKVALFIGANSEEYIASAADPTTLYKRAEGFQNDVSKMVPVSMNLKNKTARLLVGGKIKNIYIDIDDRMQDNLGLTVAFLSESHFFNPCVRHAQLQSKYTDVYFYQFSYNGPLGRNYNITLPGAEMCTHGEELFYIFRRTLNGYDNSNLSQYPAEDVLTLKRMTKLWTNFAKYMNPTPIEDPLLQNITWPKMEPDNINFVDVRKDLKIETELKKGRYSKWRQLFDTYAIPPLVTF